MNRILVTGGAGFIGCNFVRYMLAHDKDVEITNLDLLTYAGRLENLYDVEKDRRYSFIHGNIQQREIVESVVKREVDVIVNFAAETHVDRSIVEAGSFVLTDAFGCYVLLDLARKYNVEKFVQISTDEVYGSIEKDSFKESDSLNPSSPYSASKAAGDLLVQAFHRTYGLPAVITRSSNNYGPYQNPEKLIPKLIVRALNDSYLSLYGDGKQTRDWLYVVDNCEAIDIVARNGENGETYNIASRDERTNLEVAEAILQMTDKPKSLIKFVQDRPGHDRRYSLSTEKIRKLGWKPKHSFLDGLKKTVQWYKENKWWWQPLIKDKYFQLDTPWLGTHKK